MIVQFFWPVDVVWAYKEDGHDDGWLRPKADFEM